MAYNKDIVEKLSQFNNMSFTKKQWDIILAGCGCPKSTHFWDALRKNNLMREVHSYTLIDMDEGSFCKVWETYCLTNRKAVNKHYAKSKAREKAKQRSQSIQGTVFYMVGGVLTTEIPQRDI